jgi:hypothetical protein
MFAISEEIHVAIITAVAPIILALIAAYKATKSHFNRVAERMAEQNTLEHNINKEILTGLVTTVDRIDSRLDEHFSWHLHQQPNVVQIVRPPADAVEHG